MSRGLWFAMSAKTRRSLTLLWTALFLFSLAMQSIQLAAPTTVLAVHDEALFELDGNVADDGVAGKDWANVHAGTSGADSTFFRADPVNDQADDTFTGGSTKDDIDLDSWLWKAAKSSQAKNDITHAFAASYTNNLDQIIAYFGLSKWEADGNNYAGFWFLQGAVGPIGDGNPPGSPFDGVHTLGDILVLANYTNGGVLATFDVYRWVGTGGNANAAGTLSTVISGVPCAGADDDACGATNIANVSTPWAYQGRDSNGNPIAPNTMPPATFFEGGINLTALGLDQGCFTSFIAETRSSSSVDATLTDFVGGEFSFCAAPTIETQVEQGGESLGEVGSINLGGSVTDHVVVSGTKGVAEGTVDFFVCGPDASTAPACADGGTPVSTETLVAGEADSDAVTPTTAGYYCFRAEYNPAESSKYLEAEHTNLTTECFRVLAPDVNVVKTPDAGQVNAGGVASFSIKVSNAGPGTASGVTLSDPLPIGLTWALGTVSGATAADVDGVSCAVSAGPGQQTLTCSDASMAAGRSFTVSVTATTSLTQCKAYPNLATVDATNEPNTDAYTDDNTDAGAITVNCPSIDIQKSANDDLVEPNQVVTYTLNVKVVNGPLANAVVTDTLPVGQTFVAGSASPSQPSVSANGRTLTWTFASLNTGDPALTITYNVKIDANATAARQVNVAQICIPIPALCDSDDEDVTPQLPAIVLVKTAGTAADGATFITEPGNVTYSYKVTNTGTLALADVTVRDDNGTPTNAADDFSATCPKTTLAPAESMTCTFTRSVTVNTTNIAIARGVTAGGNPVQDDDPAVVRILVHGLLIDKTNNAPLVTLALPGGASSSLPTAKEGTTVTFTLAWSFAGDPVNNGIITDVLPLGVTYVAGSATSVAPFTFQAYTAATRTLTWTAPTVASSGSVTYRATIDLGASELAQPLVNVAAIASTQTARDTDDSQVFVPAVPLAATATPKITLPPTDGLSGSQAPSNPGFALMLILLVLAAVVLVVGFVTPVPASVRERPRR